MHMWKKSIPWVKVQLLSDFILFFHMGKFHMWYFHNGRYICWISWCSSTQWSCRQRFQVLLMTHIHPATWSAVTAKHTITIFPSLGSLTGFERRPGCLTYAVSLHVALVRHAVPPQTLVGIVPGETVLHPVVRCSGDHQQDITNDSTEQAPSHEAVHLELR